MMDDRDAGWSATTGTFGEALLDVERTFLKALDRQFELARGVPIDLREDPVAAHRAAWERLDNAHRELVPYLAAFSTSAVRPVEDAGSARVATARGGLQAVGMRGC